MDKSENQSLYEWIEEIRETKKRGQEKVTDKLPLQPLQPLQGDLSLCKNESNFVTANNVEPLQGRYKKQDSSLDGSDITYYTSKLESIASLCPAGCMEWLREHRPELYRSIDAAEERINSASGAELRAAVDRWAGLWLKGIKECKQYFK